MSQQTVTRLRAVIEAVSLCAPIAMFTARGLPHGMGGPYWEAAALLLCSCAIAGQVCLFAAWRIWGHRP